MNRAYDIAVNIPNSVTAKEFSAMKMQMFKNHNLHISMMSVIYNTENFQRINYFLRRHKN